MFLPAMQSAGMVIMCHSRLMCNYPGCFKHITPTFLFMAICSAVTAVGFGLGLIVLMVMVAYRRKEAVILSGVCSGDFTIGDEPMEDDPSTVWEILRCDLEEKKWGALLLKDKSVFKSLVEQYEFKFLLFHPLTLLFKLMLVGVVLFIGEPNSLSQIAGAAFVEVLQLLVYLATSPFRDPWVDTLAKGGSLHQVAQLALVSAFRADIYEDPTDRKLTKVMLAASFLYLAFVVSVIVFVVIIPVVRAQRAAQAAMNRNAGDDDANDTPKKK